MTSANGQKKCTDVVLQVGVPATSGSLRPYSAYCCCRLRGAGLPLPRRMLLLLLLFLCLSLLSRTVW